jgi:hypothetical protein
VRLLVEYRLAAAVGPPAAGAAHVLAVELDRPRRLGGDAQVPPESFRHLCTAVHEVDELLAISDPVEAPAAGRRGDVWAAASPVTA